MKKITLIASALLVSLSILAAPLKTVTEKQLSASASLTKSQFTALQKETKAQLPAAETIKVERTLNNDIQVANFDFTSAKTAKKVASLKAPAQVKDSSSFLGTIQTGIGTATPYINFATGTENYLYLIGLVNSEYKYIARFGYMTQSNVQGLSTDWLLYYSENYGLIDSTYLGIDENYDYTLPDGAYLYEIIGYTVNDEGKVDSTSVEADYAISVFRIADDAFKEYYDFTNVTANANENKTITASWENAHSLTTFDGWYRVLIFKDNAIAFDSYGGAANRYKISDVTYTTPDTVSIEDGFYEVYVYLLDANGNVVSYDGAYATVGENANAATELVATPDDETMTASLSWKSNILTYNGATVWNDVLIKDENGNTYKLSNGRDYVAAQATQTVTTEQLPAGKYSWSVLPNYETTSSLVYLAETKGENFEIKDVTAPEIKNVTLVKTSDTEVSLLIEVTDNAIGVTAADLVYNVTGDVTLTDAVLEKDGTLKLAGLTTKLYSIKITATDPSGNVSEEYEFEFTPVKDDEAPKNLKAEIEDGNVFDKYVIITVSAEDNIATAEQLTYIVTFADGTKVELQATEGLLILEGLTPETDYNVVVTVKDFGGNTSTESVAIDFTTLELQPIELEFGDIYARYYENYKLLYPVMYNFDEQDNPIELLTAALLNITDPTKISGKYSIADGSIQSGVNTKYVPDGNNTQIKFTSFELELKYLATQQVFSDGTNCGIYNIIFEGIGEDGNIYVGDFVTYIYEYYDGDSQQILPTEEFTDTNAPLIWLYGEEYEDAIDVDGTKVEIVFGAYDGPFYFNGEDPIQTEITDLTLEVVTEDGTVLASQAEGTILNTPTLDEDGEYYFTATLTNLEPYTEYTVYITAADEAGNEAEPIEVTFTTGEASGVDNISVSGDVQKFVRNGHIYIKRGTEIYNATGIRVAK